MGEEKECKKAREQGDNEAGSGYERCEEQSSELESEEQSEGESEGQSDGERQGRKEDEGLTKKKS